MKKRIQFASSGSDKNICRFLSLLLFFTLSMNLSGQNIQSMLTETWTTGNWVSATQTSYIYDVNGYKLYSITQKWDVPTFFWKDQLQTNYSNNPDGTTNIETSQLKSGTTWNDFSRTTYTYNASKKTLTSITETWMTTIWMNSTNQTYIYDGTGYLNNILGQSWDMISSNWKNSYRSNYTNNPNGTINQVVNQTWDGVSAWTNLTRSTNTYNGSGKVLTIVGEKWITGDWQNDAKVINTYDGSGYLTGDLYQLWDAIGAIFKDNIRHVYINNPNGTRSQVTIQNWDGISAWENVQRSTYTYSGTTAISETIPDSDYTIYPNPANNVITIRSKNSKPGSSYFITDQTGKMLLSGKLLDETTSPDLSGIL